MTKIIDTGLFSHSKIKNPDNPFIKPAAFIKEEVSAGG